MWSSTARFERGLTLELLALRLGVRIGLKIWPLDAVCRVLSKLHGDSARNAHFDAERLLAAEALLEALPGVPKSCLYRALSRFGFLCRRGYAAECVLAVSTQNPELGHAWVELAGQPWLEDANELQDQVPTFRYAGPLSPRPNAVSKS